MGKIIGIDLGTTYSCVSYVDDDGTIKIIEPSEGGSQVTPSVVFFDPTSNESVVGSTARQEGALYPDCMVERAKNYMGDPLYVFNVNGQEYSPAAISALILKKLVRDAEDYLGEVEGAVITCPAYFGDTQRIATRTAGENVELKNKQKLKVLPLLDEPVAAALAYGKSKSEDMLKTIMVYDLGGGTFDVTVMKINFVGEDRFMEVITTDGNHQLGGKEWDLMLTDYVRNKFCEATGADVDEVKKDPDMIQWFSENIEKAKIALTNKTSTTITPNYNGQKERIEITREIFDNETSPLLEQTIQLINTIMDAKGLSMENDIDEIVLVGGSTKMPQVSERLTAAFNKPLVSYEPDKAVAMGAAWVAHGININANKAAEASTNTFTQTEAAAPNDGRLVIEGIGTVILKCTKSYGLLATNSEGNDIVANIIIKDTEKPACMKRQFGTQTANQATINLRVYENTSLVEDATIEESTELYENCAVELQPGLPANAPIEITFDLDSSGILIITALDITNNISKVVHPVRIGGDVNNIGMAAAIGTTLK